MRVSYSTVFREEDGGREEQRKGEMGGDGWKEGGKTEEWNVSFLPQERNSEKSRKRRLKSSDAARQQEIKTHKEQTKGEKCETLFFIQTSTLFKV